MKNRKNVLLFASLLLLFACQKEKLINTEPDSERSMSGMEPAIVNTNPAGFVTNPRNLNIVYFVPTDNPALPDYKTRLSKLMIHFQNFVKSEMVRNGFGEMTFGLPYDSLTNGVKFIEVPAAQGQASYPYSASVSANKIISEINAYKSAHPEEFSNSAHTLIILPQRTDGCTSGCNPFYGYGKYCFAVDNANISVEAIGPANGSNLIGGMLHELGHGLNLPHDRAKVSEAITLGTSLMGSGNISYSKGQPTFITHGDCAILSKNEVFQPVENGPHYAGASTSHRITEFVYNYASNILTVGGRYTSSLPSAYDILYFDPLPAGVNQDYDAISWATSFIGADSFRIEVPLNELPVKGNTTQSLYNRLVLQNGSVSTSGSSNFRFVNNIPVLPDTTYLFQHGSYGGYKIALGFGYYNTADLIAAGARDNDISSIQVPLGTQVVLFDGDNFTGTYYITQGTSFISAFNDKTSSVWILPLPMGNTQKATIYKQCGYYGVSASLGIGAYTRADLDRMGIKEKDVASLKIPAGLKVVLYRDNNFRGERKIFTTDNSCITGISYKDLTGSVMVVPNTTIN